MSDSLLKQGFKQLYVKDVEFFYKELSAEKAFDLAYTIVQKAAPILGKLPQDDDLDMVKIAELLSEVVQAFPREELKQFMKDVWAASSLLKGTQSMSFQMLKSSELVLAIAVTIEVCKLELSDFFTEALTLIGSKQ